MKAPTDDSPRHGAIGIIVIGLLMATIVANLSLFPAMHEAQGRFALRTARSHDLTERMSQSGNPFIRGTWVLHHRIADLVSGGELLLPPDHGLDPVLLDQVVRVRWTEAPQLNLADETVEEFMEWPHALLGDHHGVLFRLVTPEWPTATYILVELQPRAPEGSTPVREWMLLPVTDLLAKMLGALR